jgi:tetratricopeptide (TPR) repeat protein
MLGLEKPSYFEPLAAALRQKRPLPGLENWGIRDERHFLFSEAGGGSQMNEKFWIGMLAAAVLCFCAAAQEVPAGEWIQKGQDLYENESYQESLKACDEALKIDPQNASAWHYKGMSLAGMGLGLEANQSLQRSSEILDRRLQEDPEDLEALWLRAETVDLLGRSEEALEAYSKVTELNSTHALGAWIRKSDILAALGRYNQSAESFGKAMALVPANRSQSQIEFNRLRGNNTILFTKTWLINGQIHRVSVGLYNISSKSFDEVEQINSDFVAALQLKGKAIDSNRHGGFLMGSSLNWDVYSFNVTKTLPPARPPFLIIAAINPREDEFIEIYNGLNETVNFLNWGLETDKSKALLPGHSVLPEEVVRVHLGGGQENETDLFLNSGLELNDSAGSVSLIDGSGVDVASLDYWTRLDGSIASSITAEGNFEFPDHGSQDKDLKNVAQNVSGEGPSIAEDS